MENPTKPVGENFDERANEDSYFAHKEHELIEKYRKILRIIEFIEKI